MSNTFWCEDPLEVSIFFSQATHCWITITNLKQCQAKIIQTDRQSDSQRGRQTVRQADGRMDGRTDRREDPLKVSIFFSQASHCSITITDLKCRAKIIQTDGRTDRQRGRRTDGRTDREADRQRGRQTDRQADRRTDGQTDRREDSLKVSIFFSQAPHCSITITNLK